MSSDSEIHSRLPSGTVEPDGSLYNVGMYLHWNVGEGKVTLDGEFTLPELEAIVYWMRKHAALVSNKDA